MYPILSIPEKEIIVWEVFPITGEQERQREQ